MNQEEFGDDEADERKPIKIEDIMLLAKEEKEVVTKV
jgi:hypothetical protein